MADHCSTYSLSDDKTSSFDTVCDHEHKDACSQCQGITSVIDNIEKESESITLSDEEKDDMKYIIQTAKEDIMAWKAHQLRLINQEEAKTNVINQLDDRSVVMVQDWAIKWVPMKYRESQTDWFGKRGLPWHVTVIIRSKDGTMESETLVHVFEPTTQDSSTVAAIMKHSIEVCKQDTPSLEKVHYISDNAGCYHCSTTLLAILGISHATGIQIETVNFTEAQGGKGACDRKAASIKKHVRIYANEGHDVETPEQFKQAVESHGGIPGVKVYTSKVDNKVSAQRPIDSISQFNNFCFTEAGLRVWKAYSVGEGKLLDPSKLDKVTPPALTVINAAASASRFQLIKPRRGRLQADHSESEEGRR